MLNLTKSFDILRKLPVAKYKSVNSESELNFEFPFWLKADIEAHKTELGAVLKCRNKKEAEENFSALRKKFPGKIIMQESIDGIEMIMGIKQDKVFGKLFMTGFGGINAEIIKDVSFRALPIDKKEIEKMIKELKLYPSLVARKKFALNRFVELAEKISFLGIKEADFNPIILNEKEAVIVDARIEK